MQNVGPILRNLRKYSKLTQAEQAKLIGSQQANVATYESGRKKPNLDTLTRLLESAGHRVVVRPIEQQTILSQAISDLIAEQTTRKPNPVRIIADLLERLAQLDSNELWLEVRRDPGVLGDSAVDACIGAVVERSCLLADVEYPTWIFLPERYAVGRNFLTEHKSTRANGIVNSPSQFAHRGVFIEAESLRSI